MRRTWILLVIVSFLAITLSCRRPPARARAAIAPPRPTQYQLHLGKSVFEAYFVPCHGDAGAGDGSNSFNLDPHPRDLADPVFQKSKSNADLTDTIRRGGAGVGLSSLMPPWGHTLNDRQLDAVVVYVRSLKR